ncbi:ATP synthase F1 subunit delta [Pediococcus argentinicus]|uniref:ATP synthase F1 subunit delta n=1 Tax=Pediococcus argentinicus TaxID=480391 RepID=UPI00338D5EF1
MSLDKMTIAKRYSKALFDVVAEHDQVASTREELHQVRQVFLDNDGLGKILTDKGLKHNEKLEILNLLTKSASPYVSNLIKMTFDYGRIGNLTDIIDAFDDLCDANQHIVRAKLTTAVQISDTQRDQISQQFAKRVGAKQVILDSNIDDSIIGGAILQANGLIYDGSVSSQINKIKQMLIS